jgi:serine/threonine protein kinase/Leucine-rich repeat (LRR) protein
MRVPQVEITFLRAGQPIARHLLAPGEYTIGREPECELHVDDGELSRRHARLTVNYDQVLIEDLGSRNGTFINQRPVGEATRLWPSQTIRLGPGLTIVVRRLKSDADLGGSLAPAEAAVQRMLPLERRRERRYELGAVIAQGGMGAVLSARETLTEREVAMKRMLSDPSPAEAARFVAEARVTGQLEHPNIVPVHELGVDGEGQPFYTMKMVHGRTLHDVLSGLAGGDAGLLKKYPLGGLLTIFQKVCDAMAFAHSRNVIHRDLKPANVMIGDFGEVLLMDWGIAKVLGSEEPAGAGDAAIRRGDLGLGATMDGQIMGTPHYMSAEQANGAIDILDERSDIYALGAILYEILTLLPPVEGETADEVLHKARTGDIISPLKRYKPPARRVHSHLPGARVPEALAAVTMKALSLRRSERYATVPALQAEIEAFQNGFATSAERAGLRKRLLLLMRRHRGATATGALLLVLIVAVVANILVVRHHLKATLASLRDTAPIFHERALALIESAPARPERLDEALKEVGHAIALAPDEPAYYETKGRILLTELKLPEAREAFLEAAHRRPKGGEAAAEAALCEELRPQQPAPGELTPAGLEHLQSTLQQQGHLPEALVLLRRTKNVQRIAETWAAVLKKSGIDRQPAVLPDGLLQLALGNLQLDNLNALRGMPLAELTFEFDNVSDLSPLEGMPLRKLVFHNNHVADLAPLRGMPLQEFGCWVTDVTDLTPLRGMPLETLTSNSSVTDYSVLRELPLKSLDLHGQPRLRDLSFLTGLKLTALALTNSAVEDLSPLTGLPLQSLDLGGCENLRDLSPLAKLPLTSLRLNDCPHLADLTPLHGMPLEILDLHGATALDLRPLAGSPIRWLNLASTPFADLEQLKALPKLETLILNRTPVSDFTPMHGSGVQSLSLFSCLQFRSAASLAGLTALKAVQLPVLLEDATPLRSLPALQWLSYEGPAPTPAELVDHPGKPDEFWKMMELLESVRAADPQHRLNPEKFNRMGNRFPGIRNFRKHWYYFYDAAPDTMSWSEAKKLAESMGGHLATFPNALHEEYVRKTLIGDGQGPNRITWIGGYAERPGGPWRWVTGEKFKFTRWGERSDGQNEPSSARATANDPPKTAVAYFTKPNLVNGPAWGDFVDNAPEATGFLVEFDSEKGEVDAPVAAATGAPAAEDPELIAADKKTLAFAKLKADALAQQFKFKEAAALMKEAQLYTLTGKADQEALRKRMDWLADFKIQLTQDIGTAPYTGTLTRTSGLAVTGQASDADDTAVIVKSQGLTVPIPWNDLRFESLYNLAIFYLRADLPADRLADRLWALGVWCQFSGHAAQAGPLFAKAIERKPSYAEERKLFPNVPAAK